MMTANQNAYLHFYTQWQQTPNSHYPLLLHSSSYSLTAAAEQSARIATTLKTFGIEYDHTVLVEPTATAQGLHLLLGCLQIGAIYCAINNLADFASIGMQRPTCLAAVINGELSREVDILEPDEFLFTLGNNGTLTSLSDLLSPDFEIASRAATDTAIVDTRCRMSLRHSEIESYNDLLAVWRRLTDITSEGLKLTDVIN